MDYICIKRIQIAKYNTYDKWNAFRFSVLRLHSVTVLKNNTEHFEQMESRSVEEVSLR